MDGSCRGRQKRKAAKLPTESCRGRQKRKASKLPPERHSLGTNTSLDVISQGVQTDQEVKEKINTRRYDFHTPPTSPRRRSPLQIASPTTSAAQVVTPNTPKQMRDSSCQTAPISTSEMLLNYKKQLPPKQEQSTKEFISGFHTPPTPPTHASPPQFALPTAPGDRTVTPNFLNQLRDCHCEGTPPSRSEDQMHAGHMNAKQMQRQLTNCLCQFINAEGIRSPPAENRPKQTKNKVTLTSAPEIYEPPKKETLSSCCKGKKQIKTKKKPRCNCKKLTSSKAQTSDDLMIPPSTKPKKRRCCLIRLCQWLFYSTCCA